MNNREIIKKAINDVNEIMQDKTDSWLSCAQYTRKHWDCGCQWHDHRNKIINRGERLVEAAVSYRLGCRSLVSEFDHERLW